MAGTKGFWTFKPGTPQDVIDLMIQQIIESGGGFQGLTRPITFTRPTPMVAHAGETLSPRGGGQTIYFSPTIYQEIKLDRPMDMRSAGEELMDTLHTELKRRTM